MQCCSAPARGSHTQRSTGGEKPAQLSISSAAQLTAKSSPTRQLAKIPPVRMRSRDLEWAAEQQERGGTQLVLVSDPGQDLDDEMAFIMLRHLCDSHDVVLKGVVATLYPAFDRARLCRGTLDMLGMHSVPVGIGSDGGDTKGVHSAQSFEVLASSYLPDRESESAASLERGRKLLHSLWDDAAPRSLTLVAIASLKDVALFLRDNETLFLEKTKEVVIMGGVKATEQTQAAGALSPPLIPDDAHNNQFDRAAAEYVYRRCQEIGVPLVVVSRWSAYAVQMPRSTYDQLALTGSSIGFRLRSAQRETIEQLWQRACAPEGSDARKGLPGRCDRSWFLATFCEGVDGIDAKTGHKRSGADPVWDLVASFNQYDTIAILAAVPELRKRFFDSSTYRVATLAAGQEATHLVIGRTKEITGVKEEGKAALLHLLQQGYLNGLKANLRFAREQLIVVTGSHQLEHDIRLMCLALRALYDTGTVTCLGVVVDDSLTSTTAGAVAEISEAVAGDFSIRAVLDELGLHHVKVLSTSSGDGQSGEQHIADLYADALPSGLSLVITSAATAGAAFASTRPDLFRSRTAKVILVGDAVKQRRQVQSTVDAESPSALREGREELVPDPEGANWLLDVAAAEQLFAAAQEHEVPLICLSRELSRSFSVPPAMYDGMAASCGSVGKSLLASQRSDIAQLFWRVCALDETERGGLPRRCDRQWFANTFCSGRQELPGESATEEEIWASVDRLACHAPLAVLACVPNFLRRYTAPSLQLTVLSAEHSVVRPHMAMPIRHNFSCGCVLVGAAELIDHTRLNGQLKARTASTEAADAGLRSMAFQCLFHGARANLSEFELAPGQMELGLDEGGVQQTWQFDSRESALAEMLGLA